MSYVAQYHEYIQQIVLQNVSNIVFLLKAKADLWIIFYILFVLILNLNFFILKLGLTKYNTQLLNQHISTKVVKLVKFPNMLTCLYYKGDSIKPLVILFFTDIIWIMQVL